MQVNLMGIILILVLVLINAFFAASEIAVISTRRVKIQRLEEEGNRSAKVLVDLIEDPSRFLATIQVGITFAGFLASATAAVGLSKVLTQFFLQLGVPQAYAGTVGVFVVTLAISYLTLVLGELAPKRLAMQWSEKVALKVARPINFIAILTSPITRFLTLSTNVVVRLFGGNPQQQEKEITEDEIRLYIAEHHTLPAEEKTMIEGVFNFGDRVVRQLMVPRTEILYLNESTKLNDALTTICDYPYTTFPVYQKDYDDIVGMVNMHTLVCQAFSNDDVTIADVMSPALFVPETKSTFDLLKELHQQGKHMAIVVDEYGGTAGLVTREDLFDEIVGDVVDEQKLVRKTAPGNWLVQGDIPIHDVVEILGLKKVKLNGEYETIAGFVLEQLGHLPEEGEEIYWEGYTFKVEEMRGRRIKKVGIVAEVAK